MTARIGIRELQQNAARYIREVEQAGTEFAITKQGRATGVALCKASEDQEPKGATLDQLQRSRLWRNSVGLEAQEKLLAYITDGREAVGRIAVD